MSQFIFMLNQIITKENEMTKQVDLKSLPNLRKLPNQDYWTQGADNDPFGRKNQNNKSAKEILDDLDATVAAFFKLQGK